jgi:hypothetical protein
MIRRAEVFKFYQSKPTLVQEIDKTVYIVKNLLAEAQKGDDEVYSFAGGRTGLSSRFNFSTRNILDLILGYWCKEELMEQPENNFQQCSIGSMNDNCTMGERLSKVEERAVSPNLRREERAIVKGRMLESDLVQNLEHRVFDSGKLNIIPITRIMSH